MTTRIYAVAVADAVERNPTRLVRAGNQAQALRHVAKASFEVRVATQDDLVSALSTGATVEEAGAEEAVE